MNPQPFKSFISRFITERIGETGLTESQAVFLMILDDDRGASLKEVTERVCVHKSLTTRAVKHLLGAGLAANIAESGKEHSIVLTEKGMEAKMRVSAAFDELFGILMEDLTDEEFTAMERALAKIKRKMEELSLTVGK